MSNELMILNYLLKKGYITTMEAMRKLDITDPQHYIMILRRKGYLIDDTWEVSKKGKRYKRYYLRKVGN